jgi:ATP-dependent protease HslVU (ClpYQ) peptidase subunit
MTVVAALVTKTGWAYMGADIGASTEGSYSLMAEPKVMAFYDDSLVGYAGSIQQGRRAFSFLMDIAGPNKVKAFEDAWTKDDYGDTDFLFIEQGRIYEIQSDGSVVEIRQNADGTTYSAIGGGASVALGALYVDHIDMNSVLQAIDAASAHVPGIYGPPVIIDCPPA